MRNYFTFGEYDSRDFGVYISGDGTYNAPARVYNAISVPGRNGDLLIDEGKFENISVKYPAFIAGDNFVENLAAFRSAMLSTRGYARLTDTYHPDEFRLAYYGDEIIVKARNRNDAGEFDIIFDCKPQRFLLSGEETITYPPGRESKNFLPYPYDATSEDIGGIHFEDNGDGSITISGKRTGTASYTFRNLAPMPSLTVGERYALNGCPANTGSDNYYLGLKSASSGATIIQRGTDYQFTYNSGMQIWLFIVVLDSNQHDNLVIKPMIRKASDTDPTWGPYINPMSIDNPTLFDSNPLIRVTGNGTVTIGDEVITVGSGYSYVDIDSEIQNCYCGLQNANSVVSFGDNKFPTLKPGITGISYSSGVTSVKITPRWYRL